MPIQTTSSATPLSLREPILIGSLVAMVVINAAMPHLEDFFNYQDWFASLYAGFGVSQCLLCIMLAGLTGRSWLAAYSTTLLTAVILLTSLLIAVTWGFGGAATADMYLPFLTLPLVVLIASAPTIAARQFFGCCVARESKQVWSRTPLGIEDVFLAMALAASFTVFARAPLVAGTTGRDDLWPGLISLSLVGLLLGLVVVLPAVYLIFASKTRTRMLLGLLGLAMLPFPVVAVISVFISEPGELVSNLADGMTTFVLVVLVVAACFGGLLLALYTRGYRLLRIPLDTNTPHGKSHSIRWIVAAVVVVAVIANLIISPIEEAHQRLIEADQWMRINEGRPEFDDQGAMYKLSFVSTTPQNEDYRLLAEFPKLRHLVLTNTDTNDVGLQHIAAMVELASFELDTTFITDDGIAHLRNLTKLTSLSLRANDVTGTGFAQLSSLHIKKLDLRNSSVTDEGCAGIATLSELSELNLNGAAIGDVGLDHLGKLTKLTKLKLQETGITGKGFASFGEMPELQHLDVGETSCDDHVARLFETSPKLSHLDLSNTEITDAGIAKLRGHAGIEWLNVSGTAITDDGLSALGELPKLRSLWLVDSAITGEAFKKLNAPQLQTLSLQGTKVTDEAIAHLARFSALKSLVLSETNGDDALRHLSGIDLLSLSILGTKVTAQGLIDAGLRVGVIEVEAGRFTPAEHAVIEQELGCTVDTFPPLNGP